MPLSTDPSTLPTRAPVAATKSPQNATRDAERKAPSLGRAWPLGKALPQRCRWGPQTHDDDEDEEDEEDEEEDEDGYPASMVASDEE